MTGLERPDWYWEIAIAANAVVKGVLGAQGESGHICASAQACHIQLDCSRGLEVVVRQLASTIAGDLQNGDVVVLADKVVALTLGRIGPLHLLTDPDPKTVSELERAALAIYWTRQLGFTVETRHLLLADEYDGRQSTLGTDDPNMRAADIAKIICEVAGSKVDVVISDTDTGIDVRTFLIGTLTLGATPLGATRGINLYEAMRCAVAAEFVRGHQRGIPLVICKPAQRRRNRTGTGEARSYSGFLDAEQEAGLTHA